MTAAEAEGGGPALRLTDWSLGRAGHGDVVLEGRCHGHPAHADGMRVRTSRVVEVAPADGGLVVKTRDSTYRLAYRDHIAHRFGDLGLLELVGGFGSLGSTVAGIAGSVGDATRRRAIDEACRLSRLVGRRGGTWAAIELDPSDAHLFKQLACSVDGEMRHLARGGEVVSLGTIVDSVTLAVDPDDRSLDCGYLVLSPGHVMFDKLPSLPGPVFIVNSGDRPVEADLPGGRLAVGPGEARLATGPAPAEGMDAMVARSQEEASARAIAALRGRLLGLAETEGEGP